MRSIYPLPASFSTIRPTRPQHWEASPSPKSASIRSALATAERFAPAWSELLHRAVAEPGVICVAYTCFHGYSLGNRFAALIQCEMRGLEPGPLNSFNGWRKLGYAIQEGERALTLCMPLKGIFSTRRNGSRRSELIGYGPGSKLQEAPPQLPGAALFNSVLFFVLPYSPTPGTLSVALVPNPKPAGILSFNPLASLSLGAWLS